MPGMLSRQGCSIRQLVRRIGQVTLVKNVALFYPTETIGAMSLTLSPKTLTNS